MTKNLLEIQRRIIELRDARDWKQFHTPKDMALSLVLEAAEFMEHFQWKTEDECLQHLENHKEAVAEELVDVLYWVLLIANDFNVDLYDTSLKKLKKTEEKYSVEKSKGNHKKYTEL